MAGVHGTYEHGRYQKNKQTNQKKLKSLRLLSNIHPFAMQDGWPDGQPASRTVMTDYIDPYITHMDQQQQH